MTKQTINSGYLEGMLEIFEQFDNALEAHKDVSLDQAWRKRKLRAELVDVKVQLEEMLIEEREREQAVTQ